MTHSIGIVHVEQPSLGERRQRRVGDAAGALDRRHGVDAGGGTVGEHPEQSGVVVDVGGSGEAGQQGAESVDGEDDRLAARPRLRLTTSQFVGEEADEARPALGVVDADDRAAVG